MASPLPESEVPLGFVGAGEVGSPVLERGGGEVREGPEAGKLDAGGEGRSSMSKSENGFELPNEADVLAALNNSSGYLGASPKSFPLPT